MNGDYKPTNATDVYICLKTSSLVLSLVILGAVFESSVDCIPGPNLNVSAGQKEKGTIEGPG